MTQSIVRRTIDFYSFPRILINAVIYGVVIPVAFLVVMGMLGLFKSSGGGHMGGGNFVLALIVLALSVVYGLILLSFPLVHWSRIGSTLSCFSWGALLAACLIGATTTAISFHERVRAEEVVMILLIGVPSTGAVFCLLWWGACVWQRRVRKRVVVLQDGTLCPACAYSLIGNESMTCPECGGTFAFADLGVSSEEFEQISAARKSETSAGADLDKRPVTNRLSRRQSVGLGLALGVLAVGVAMGTMLICRELRFAWRGLELFIPPFAMVALILVIGTSIKVRRMRHWNDAVLLGAVYGLVVAVATCAFIVAEVNSREWMIPVLAGLGISQACISIACITAALGLAVANMVRSRRRARDARRAES